MDFYYLSLISGFSIALAVIIGLVRIGTINQTYRPFVIICIASLLNELLSFILLRSLHTNAVNANIYVWLEAILYLWLFQSWGAFQKKSWHYAGALLLVTAIWVFDNLVWNWLTTFNSLFRVCYSFGLIFLSIDQVNKLLVRARGSLLRDPRFLICTGVLIFYTYKATIEVFYLFKIEFSDLFYNNIYFILNLINIVVNLIFALAILWIPKKQKFILPY